jgi:DNA mismatch repair protein MutS
MAKPMYNKYFEVWTAHVKTYGPRTAVLYQVGGFFEIYDIENLTTGATRSNIRELADVCQFSLSTAPVSKDEQSLFGGFPEHALPKYEKILVGAGFTVVVVTQKKVNGSVESRSVDHISSPGCFVENKDRCLVGIVLERTVWAAAAFDASTGSFRVVEGADKDRLHQFLCAYPPSELVLWTDGTMIESLKSACDLVHVHCLSPASVALEEACLTKYWSKTCLIPLQMLPQARRCLSNLLEFAQDHVPSLLVNLADPLVWLPTDEVRLGNAALEQLGVISFKGRSLYDMMNTCRSVAGKRLLRARLIRPITDIAELRNRINAYRFDLADRPDTERHLRALYDTSRLFRRVELGTASLSDMACLLRSYQASKALLTLWAGSSESLAYLTEVMRPWNIDMLVRLSSETIPLEVPLEAPSSVTETLAVGKEILVEAAELCKKWSAYIPVKKTVETIHVDTSEGLRIIGNKRSVTAVHAYLKDSGVDATIISYKTMWCLETDEVLNLAARYQSWYSAWISTWSAFWTQTLTIFASGRPDHDRVENETASIDIVWSIKSMAIQWGWTLPTFVDASSSWLSATEIRHPMIEQIHTKVPYVKQSLGLGIENPGLLLFGLNASGKSSLMKAIGLSTLLAQCGFPVPATEFSVAPFTAIFTRILGNDNLWAGLSSFAVEMTEFREVLQHADAQTLVLGDELCSGTETLSATAIVAAGLETLVARGSKFLFATHLHELGKMSIPQVRIAHLAVHYDEATGVLVYDRNLREGSGSSMYGLEVCRALDMPQGFLQRALEIRKTLTEIRKTLTDSSAKLSPYSRDSVVTACEVCGSAAGLETHHIQHQATFTGPASELNAARNLTTLCSVCHDDHHAGTLTIKGWEETSAGRRLVWSRLKTGLDPEVTAFIRGERTLKKPIATIQRVVEQLYGVKLNTAQIRSA